MSSGKMRYIFSVNIGVVLLFFKASFAAFASFSLEHNRHWIVRWRLEHISLCHCKKVCCHFPRNKRWNFERSSKFELIMSSSGKNKGALRGWEMLHALWNWNRHDVYKAASSEKISQLCVISCSLLLRFTVKNEWKIIPHAIFSFLRVVVYARSSSGHWGVHFIRISKWDFKIAGASRIRLGERESFF